MREGSMDETKKDFFEDTYGVFTEYVDDRILLLKIQAAEKSGKVVALTIKMAVLALFAFFIMLFLSMMGGYYFAELTGSMFYGFCIIAGIYVVLLLIFLVVYKNVLSKRLIDVVIKIFFEKSSTEAALMNEDDE
jgi:hypothetical protein